MRAERVRRTAADASDDHLPRALTEGKPTSWGSNCVTIRSTSLHAFIYSTSLSYALLPSHDPPIHAHLPIMGIIRGTIRLALLAGTAAGAVGLYEANRLSRRYSWVAQPDVQKPRALNALLPLGLGETETLSTTVPRLPYSSKIADPLETFLDAFYDGWSLKLESWVARKLAYKSRLPAKGTGREFAAGLFPELYRNENMAVHWWSAPAGKPDESGKLGPSPAGAHFFSAVETPNGIDIAFGASQLQPPYAPKDPKILEVLHGFYMRHLFDEARHKMEKWAKQGRA